MTPQAMRLAGLAGVLGVAVIRAMVVIEPNIWFADIDPALDQMPLLALGGAGSHILDLALMAAAALAIVGEWRSGRGVRTRLVLLALAPVPVAAMHAHLGALPENGFRADTWIAAMLAFVALAHLVRDDRMRATAVAVLLPLVGLLAVRGAVQVLVEHPATVALYEETRERFLAQRGWAADSSAARTYERRLHQPEAAGWFGLSNPYSTMMGVGVVGLAGFAAAARRRQQSGNTLLLAVGALGCAALLLVNGGKGAIGATLIAGALLVLAMRRQAAPSPRWALALAACMLVAVGARWIVGTRIGELSMLFRGYYLEGGLRIMSDTDIAILGTGPERVQEFFNAAKPANCPEDVKSLHSMFADWVVAFGISGAAWCALVGAAFWRRRDTLPTIGAATVAGEVSSRFAVITAVAAAVVATLIGMRVEEPTVDAFWLVSRIVGILALALLSHCVAHAAGVVSRSTLLSIAFAMGVLVLIHAQIETVAWMPASCVLALALIACASDLGPVATARAGRGRLLGASVAAVLLVTAVLSASIGLAHDFDREARFETVARSLAPVASEPAREYELRMAAAKLLAGGDGAWSRLACEAAVEQAFAASICAGNDADSAAGALEVARRAAWSRQLVGPRADGLRADVAARLLRALPASAEGTEQAVTLLVVIEDGANAMPRSPRRWAEVGTARAIVRRMLASQGVDAGNSGDPREAFERALEVSDGLSLDPLAQLSDREVAFIRAEIARLREPSDPQR